MDARVLKLNTTEECEVLRRAALEMGDKELVMDSRRRKVQIKALVYGELNEVERECIEALYAYEEVLTERLGRTQKASRTWPMINKYGIIEAVEKVVNRKANAIGYTALVEMGLKEYAFEAVILRHPEAFSNEAVERSRYRMSEQNDSFTEADATNAWSDEELLASVEVYFQMQDLERVGARINKKSYYKKLAHQFGRTPTAYEYRMQNISYVLSLMGRAWLKGLKPAKNVGVNIAVKLEAMINSAEGKTSSPIVQFEMSVLAEAKKHLSQKPTGNINPKSSLTQVTQYARDILVKAWVLQRANGHCECCNKEAPFKRPDGSPYLEVHHVQQISDDGPDTPSNTVALCPNCHREIHYGINAPMLALHLYNSISELSH